MNIRKGTMKDYDALLDLHLQLEAAEIQFDSNLVANCYSTKVGRERLKKRIRKRNSILLVCENDDGKVIGFVDGEVMNKAWWYHEKVAMLDYICVDEDYRRRGIAHMLFLKFEKKYMNKALSILNYLLFLKIYQLLTFIKNMVLWNIVFTIKRKFKVILWKKLML